MPKVDFALWYPKAATPVERFKDRLVTEFQSLKRQTLWSWALFDTVEEQKAFADKEDFPFLLLSDPERTVGELYGVTRHPTMTAGWPRRASF